ncbi:MAG: glycosyltransferase family 4 protein [Planctomycetota bacterium]
MIDSANPETTTVPPLRGPVVHVDTEHGFSGGEVQVFLLMEGLRRRGLEQVLVAPNGSESARRARERGFLVHEIAMRNSLDLASVWRLARVLRTAGIAHLHTGRAAWLGSLAANRARCPVVVTRRMDRKVKRGFRTWYAYTRTAKTVVAISPAVRQCLLDGGVPSARIEVVWEALDDARIAVTKGRALMRRELGLDDSTFALLVLAVLTKRKGVDVLLAAMKRLASSASFQNLCLFVGGDGPEMATLQAMARDLGIEGRVRFLGRRHDAGDLLAACDAFVLPSRAEGLGVAALEALGAGRPVIASRVGGLGEMVIDGQCGLLVPPEDDSALANAIAALEQDRALAQRLGLGGPLRIDQGFRLEQLVERHLRIYSSAARAE